GRSDVAQPHWNGLLAIAGQRAEVFVDRLHNARREWIAEVGSGYRADAVVERGDEGSFGQTAHCGGYDVEAAAAQRRVKDRAARADHRLLIHFESQSHAGTEVVVVAIVILAVLHTGAAY